MSNPLPIARPERPSRALRTRIGRFVVRSRSVDAKARAARQPRTYAEAARLFDYGGGLPLGIEVLDSKQQAGATVEDIVFPSPSGEDVGATLVRPGQRGVRAAAVLFVHWLGHHSCNRGEFLEDALALASKGTVSLLLDAQWSDRVEKVYDFDEATAIQQVIDLRRGLDVLLAQPGVDPARVAYVGHDYGAMYGSIVAGVDRRVKAAVLMTPTAHLSTWNLIVKSRPDPEDYAARMAIYDPAVYLSHAALAGLYLQFARADKYVSEQDAQTIIAAAQEPKLVSWYDADHDLAADQVRADRLSWLSKQLQLD